MRVRVTVTVGGHGMAGEGLTPELVRALRAAGFDGSTEQWTMTRVTDEDLSAVAVTALATQCHPSASSIIGTAKSSVIQPSRHAC